ncbi:MAG: hypothetical protein COZ08_12125, partial [Bacteroidetes bacterium CG_4_10_14_3_um_filter_42_6]
MYITFSPKAFLIREKSEEGKLTPISRVDMPDAMTAMPMAFWRTRVKASHTGFIAKRCDPFYDWLSDLPLFLLIHVFNQYQNNNNEGYNAENPS